MNDANENGPTQRWRIAQLEQRLQNTLTKTEYEAHERRRDLEHTSLVKDVQEIRDTLRWQGRTLLLWVLGLIVSIITAVVGLIT